MKLLKTSSLRDIPSSRQRHFASVCGFIGRMQSKTSADANIRLSPCKISYTVDALGQAIIYDQDEKQVLQDADFVYFKSWEQMPERAGALACYLKARGVIFDDTAIYYAGTTKLSQTFRLWAADCPVIPTIISSELPSRELVRKTLGDGSYLIKPQRGEKGSRTIVVDSYDELAVKVGSYGTSWMIQAYIENRGDYRVFVYGNEVRGAMRRKSIDGSIVNNNKGAESEHITTRS
jgi:glutathione synthase/RimK-type ligase-like ATP-grasp enzyme